jgi:hypothetical protein
MLNAKFRKVLEPGKIGKLELRTVLSCTNGNELL